jgi:hypothetical protein
MKRKPLSQTKWRKFAVRLAKLKNGQSFRIDPARYGRQNNVFRFAREIRNGLNGHNRVMLIRRTVAVRGRLIEIKRYGDWARAEGESRLTTTPTSAFPICSALPVAHADR